MKQINAYLSFSGNCREAMTFYKDALGGELTFMTNGESPMAEQLPAEMKDNIMHATLINGNITIMGSDMGAMSGVTSGNSVSLMIQCSSEQEIRMLYDNLAKGGNPSHPIETTFWNALFGGLTDKYGVNWLLNFDKGSNG